MENTQSLSVFLCFYQFFVETYCAENINSTDSGQVHSYVCAQGSCTGISFCAQNKSARQMTQLVGCDFAAGSELGTDCCGALFVHLSYWSILEKSFFCLSKTICPT